MHHEVITDDRIASRDDLEVGDTVYLGGTLAVAADNEFTVVGISSTDSQFVVSPTVEISRVRSRRYRGRPPATERR